LTLRGSQLIEMLMDLFLSWWVVLCTDLKHLSFETLHSSLVYREE
jgi:hypothetical protein